MSGDLRAILQAALEANVQDQRENLAVNAVDNVLAVLREHRSAALVALGMYCQGGLSGAWYVDDEA